MGQRKFFRRLTLDLSAGEGSSDNPTVDSVEFKRPHTITGLVLHIPAGHEAEVPIWFRQDRGTWLPDDGGEIRLDDTSDFGVIEPDDPADFETVGTRAMYEVAGYNEDSQNSHELQVYLHGYWGEPDG
jgi:hypothetical protein